MVADAGGSAGFFFPPPSRDGTTESELVAALFGVVGSAVVSFPLDVFFLA